MFGSIQNLLSIGGGWTIIKHVKDIRKIIRKLNQNKSQIERDIEVFFHHFNKCFFLLLSSFWFERLFLF